jgi:hypothetical protein
MNQYSLKASDSKEKLLDSNGNNGTDGSPDSPSMSLEEAIRIIQINERGRQGRLKARETKEMRALEKEQQHHLQQKKTAKTQFADPEQAAIIIQKRYVTTIAELLQVLIVQEDFEGIWHAKKRKK